MAIQSFGDKITADFFLTGQTGKRTGWLNVKNLVRRKLDMIHYASQISDLRAPPGNRLEALKGNLGGFYSIRVNDQWRIIFRWPDLGPVDVQVIDYHR